MSQPFCGVRKVTEGDRIRGRAPGGLDEKAEEILAEKKDEYADPRRSRFRVLASRFVFRFGSGFGFYGSTFDHRRRFASHAELEAGTSPG